MRGLTTKAFDSAPHEWIVRYLELFKVSPGVVSFLKYNLKRWKTQLILANDDNELEGLLRIVKGFSDDIGMEFGLSKCAKATFKRGKLEKSDHVWLDEETMIKDLEQEKVYKYLGVDESSAI